MMRLVPLLLVLPWLAQDQDPIAKARAQFDRKDYGGALATLNEVLEAEADNVKALVLRGHCHVALRNVMGGLNDGLKAQELAPKDPDPWYLLSVVSFRMGRLKDSKSLASKAIELAPGRVDALLLRAQIFMREKAWNEAMKDVTTAEAADKTGDKGLYINLRIRILQEKGDVLGAVKAAGEWVAAEPDKVDPYIQRATMNIQLGQYSAAAADLEKVLEIDPDHAAAKTALSRVRGLDDKPLPKQEPKPEPEKKPEAGPEPEAKPATKRPSEPKGKSTAQTRKLEKLLGAGKGGVVVLPDGRYYATLAYDMKDYPSKLFVLGNGVKKTSAGISLRGAPKMVSILTFEPKFEEDFRAQIVCSKVGQADKAVVLMGTGDAQSPTAFGRGVGVRAIRVGAWTLDLIQLEKGVKPISDGKRGPAEASSMTLELFRSGSSCVGSMGDLQVEGRKGPGSGFRLKVLTTTEATLERFEVSGYLETAWVKETLNPPAPTGMPKIQGRNLFNGKDLTGWRLGGDRPFTADSKGIAMRAGGMKVGNLMSYTSVSADPVRLVVEIEVTRISDRAAFGIGILHRGRVLTDDGNVMAVFGKLYDEANGMRFSNITAHKWKSVTRKPVKLEVRPGRYVLEMIRKGSELTFRVNGEVELRANNLVPPGASFRPSFSGQDVDLIIKGYYVDE